MTDAASDKVPSLPGPPAPGGIGVGAEAKATAAEIVQTPAEYRPRQTLTQLIEREDARRRRRHLYWWGLLLAVPALGAAAWYVLQPAPAPFAERFRAQAVAQGDIVREVLATGNVAAVTTVQVGAEISGRIASVDVDYNSPVKAGQVMARFDRTILEAQLGQVLGNLAAAEAQLQQAKADNEHVIVDLRRAERLHASRTISDADYEAVVTNARQAEQRVAASQALVATQQAATRLARTNLDHATIVAPINGIM